MGDTKERILCTALRLFSEQGYEAVSVHDIASELGITKGALYRHFDNKRNIFDSILARMEQQDAMQAKDQGMPEADISEMEHAYQSVSIDQIISFSKAMFRYWTLDAFASCFRKMLMLEQFRDPQMNRLFQQYLVSGPIGYLIDLFSARNLKQPAEAAVALYAPMFLMYSVFDGAEEKDTVLLDMDRILDSRKRALLEEQESGV